MGGKGAECHPWQLKKYQKSGKTHSSVWPGRCFSLCHWEPSRVHGDDGECSLYDGITLPMNCCYVHKEDFMYIVFCFCFCFVLFCFVSFFFFCFFFCCFLILFSLFMIIFHLFSCNLVGAISHTLCVLWWHPHLSYLLCKNHSCHCKLLFVLCERWKQMKLNWIELNWILVINLVSVFDHQTH